MKKTSFVLSLALLIGLQLPARAQAGSGDSCILDECTPRTTSDGYQYTYSHGEFHGSEMASTGTVGGVRSEYFYELACTGNETMDANGDGAGHNCAAAFAICPIGKIAVWTFIRPAGSLLAPLRRPGSHCIGTPKTVSLATAQAAFIRYLKDAHLPKPTIVTAPPTGGLVNLPQIFATTDNPPVTLAVTVPLPASLTAEAHYGWDYGDGTAGPDTAGTPFRPGILPADHPDYYLTHTYLTNATVASTLTVTWRAGFTVTGIAGTFPIPDIVFTTTRTLPIRQAHSELVAGP